MDFRYYILKNILDLGCAEDELREVRDKKIGKLADQNGPFYVEYNDGYTLIGGTQWLGQDF